LPGQLEDLGNGQDRPFGCILASCATDPAWLMRARPKDESRTGSRPSPARAGSPCCACSDRSSPGSTRPGARRDREDRL